MNFIASSALFGFAVTYLLEQGFSPTMAGILMAACNFLNCVIQPLLGDLVDRLNRFVYPQIMMGFYGCSIACMLVVQIVPIPMALTGILYMLSCLFLTINTSVNNSLCVYYTSHGKRLNYSLGIGIGSLAYSFGSLFFGYLIALCGAGFMLWVCIVVLLGCIVLLKGYPEAKDGQCSMETAAEPEADSVSLLTFMVKYRRYMVMVIGVMLIAMCHTMAESYLIKIFETVGGNSEQVGIALFVACIIAAPIQIFFEKVQERFDISILMKLGAFFFILKPLFLVLVTQSGQVYLIQTMQVITYGLLYPSLFYYARRSIPLQDKSKAQAVVTAFYALGLRWETCWADA